MKVSWKERLGLQKRSTTVNLTEGPIAKSILMFALPLLVGQILQQFYNLADAWVIGNFADNNAVTGITTDIMKMNLFKARVTNAINDEFNSMDKTEITVSLGTASGINLFSGWGPYVDVDVGFSSSTQSDFENVFASAGINQTQHSVMLNVETTVILTMSGKRIKQTVKTTFCVAQTVIVGTVPGVMVDG